MHWQIDPHAHTPPWRQLVDLALDALARGELGVEEPLPSVRKLAAEALVNPNTVARAYRELEALGICKGRSGLGVFVTPAGPSLASAERLPATLESFRQSANEALRAGHSVEELTRSLEELGAIHDQDDRLGGRHDNNGRAA